MQARPAWRQRHLLGLRRPLRQVRELFGPDRKRRLHPPGEGRGPLRKRGLRAGHLDLDGRYRAADPVDHRRPAGGLVRQQQNGRIHDRRQRGRQPDLQRQPQHRDQQLPAGDLYLLHARPGHPHLHAHRDRPRRKRRGRRPGPGRWTRWRPSRRSKGAPPRARASRARAPHSKWGRTKERSPATSTASPRPAPPAPSRPTTCSARAAIPSRSPRPTSPATWAPWPEPGPPTPWRPP